MRAFDLGRGLGVLALVVLVGPAAASMAWTWAVARVIEHAAPLGVVAAVGLGAVALAWWRRARRRRIEDAAEAALWEALGAPSSAPAPRPPSWTAATYARLGGALTWCAERAAARGIDVEAPDGPFPPLRGPGPTVEPSDAVEAP